MLAQSSDLYVKEPASRRAPTDAERAAINLPVTDSVDQLDLDGDGLCEVFVQECDFDAYGYAIYKRSRSIWRQIYSTTGDAC